MLVQILVHVREPAGDTGVVTAGEVSWLGQVVRQVREGGRRAPQGRGQAVPGSTLSGLLFWFARSAGRGLGTSSD